MTEIDVTLTDYALAALAWYCSWRLKRFRNQATLRLWTVFFLTCGIAAFCGGTVHGFFNDLASTTGEVLWLITMISVGITAASAWMMVGRSWHPGFFKKFAIATFLIYLGVIIFYSTSFSIVVINYIPATAALLGASVNQYFTRNSIPHGWIAGGLGLTFVAAYFQQAQIGIHPTYFNHNATYHVVQALGLWFMYLGARRLAEKPGI